MIDKSDLRKIAQARLKDAEVLFRARRYDGATYVCGYAVEVALKARICRTLHWLGYPATRGEFQNYQSLRTHDLDVLLHLSGMEDRIKTRQFAAWSSVTQWDPEVRYKLIGNASRSDAKSMIESAKILLGVL